VSAFLSQQEIEDAIRTLTPAGSLRLSASSISAINQRLDASLAHHEAEALATADQVDAQRRGGEKLPAR
jgi:hypothetical protein